MELFWTFGICEGGGCVSWLIHNMVVPLCSRHWSMLLCDVFVCDKISRLRPADAGAAGDERMEVLALQVQQLELDLAAMSQLAEQESQRAEQESWKNHICEMLLQTLSQLPCLQFVPSIVSVSAICMLSILTSTNTIMSVSENPRPSFV